MCLKPAAKILIFRRFLFIYAFPLFGGVDIEIRNLALMRAVFEKSEDSCYFCGILEGFAVSRIENQLNLFVYDKW